MLFGSSDPGIDSPTDFRTTRSRCMNCNEVFRLLLSPLPKTMNAFRLSLRAAALLLAGFYLSDRLEAEISVGLSAEVTVDTRAAELTSPASNSLLSSPINVTFMLPGAAQSGSVKLIFIGNVTRELTLAAIYESPGTHSFSLDPGNPTGSASVIIGRKPCRSPHRP